MTHPESQRRVDAALQSLAREVEPGRDLWPDIMSRLEPRSKHRAPAWAWQAAAAVLLVAVSSLVTAGLVRRSSAPVAQVAAPAVRPHAVPAALGSDNALNADYEAARRQLGADLEQRLATLPPSARQKLESNLAEMRRAAEEINAALARQPGDPLLEELLLNTYQDELGVLASVNQLTSTSAAVAPARQEKMQL
jgi:hypothetical protein